MFGVLLELAFKIYGQTERGRFLEYPDLMFMNSNQTIFSSLITLK